MRRIMRMMMRKLKHSWRTSLEQMMTQIQMMMVWIVGYLNRVRQLLNSQRK